MQQPLALQEIGTPATLDSKYKTWKRKYNGQGKKEKAERDKNRIDVSRLLFLNHEA